MFSTTALSRFTSIIICLSRPPITDSVCPERALKREIGKTIAFPSLLNLLGRNISFPNVLLGKNCERNMNTGSAVL